MPQLDESGNPVLDESGNPITDTVTTPVYSEVALDRSHAVTLDVRRYDGANRVVSSGPVNLPPSGTGVASGTIVSSGNTGPLHASYMEALAGSNTNQPGSTATTTRYDAAGRVLSQHVVNEVDGTRSYDVSYEKTVVTGTHTVQVQTGTTPVLDESGSPTYDESGNAITVPVYTTQTVTDTAEVSTYDAAGNALGYRVTQNGTVTDYTFSQAVYEGYQEGGVSAVSSAGSSGSTGEQYDANGFLVGLTDSTQGANNRSFVNDANGHILRKNQQGNLLNQLVVNGQVMGTYGVGTDPSSPTNSDGSPNYTTQGNFDLGYQPVTNSYPAAATGQYPIKSGDTLQSIAQAAYGDSQLWYQIAQANGLSGNADLRVGQIINIPTRVGGTHNTANTFAPYDPSKVEGSTSPNLPAPSSDDGGGCGVIGQVIMIVVAVVVTIYTAGAAAGAFGAVATGTAGTTAGAVAGTEAALGAAAGTVGGTFTTGLAAMAGGYGVAGVGAAVVGGAVGSIASQAVGNAIGAEHGFSWSQVALSGVAAGVTAGVGAAASGTALAATQGSAGVVAGIGRAAIGSVATQGIAVAVGLQDHFSWQSVAASAVAGGVGAAVGGMAGSALAGSGLSAGVQRAVAGTVAGLAAGTTAAVMRGGRVEIAQIAADAFGNALGSSLAEANSAPPDVLGQKIAELQRSPIWNASGIDSAPSSPSFDANAAYNQLVENFSAAQNGTSSAPGVLLAANDLTQPGQPVVMSDVDDGGHPYQRSYTIGNTTYAEASRIPFDDTDAALGGGGVGAAVLGGGDGHAARVAELQAMAGRALSDGEGDYVDANGVQHVLITGTGPRQLPDIQLAQGQAGTPVSVDPVTGVEVYAVSMPSISSQPLPEPGSSSGVGGFQATNDAKVYAGNYDRFQEIGNALMAGQFGDAWRHVNFEASPDAQAVNHARLFPEPNPAAARFEKMLTSPVGSGLYGIAKLSGASQHTQDVLLGTGALAENLFGGMAGFGGGRVQMSGQFASTRRVRAQDTVPSNLTERGTFTNLYPNDPAVAQRPIRTLVQDGSGRYWLQSPGGNRITPSGSYDFVTMPNGTIRVSRPNPNPDFSTHLGLSGGGEVGYAGSIRFGNNMGPNRGAITSWSNSSGHYVPASDLNGNAGLPLDIFKNHAGR
ncbi:LysM peptidoglycan-binding domain-containing protein [Ralstonia pseudosolanacearum]